MRETAQILSGVELRTAIALEILQWKPFRVGPDANGNNECEVLTEGGVAIPGFSYPRLGKLALCYHAPDYRGGFGLEKAMELVRRVGLPVPASQLPSSGEEIAWMCLCHHRVGMRKAPVDYLE